MSDLLHFQIKGIGRTVIFLHGFLESSKMWENVVIPEEIQVIYIDLPGHGKSIDSNLLSDSMEGMAQKVFDIVDELELSTYKVIGHSMGGYVALSLKSLDSRCGEIMLLNSNFWCDSDSKKIERNRIAEIVKTKLSHFLYEVIPNLFIDPETHDLEVKSLISDAKMMTPESVASASLAMSLRIDQTHIIKKHPNSVTIIQGEQDPIVDVVKMRNDVKTLQVNYIELENTGHMTHIEAQEDLLVYLKEFMVYISAYKPSVSS